MTITAVLASSGAASQADPQRSDLYASELRPLIAKYCRRCHGGRRPKGDVSLLRARNAEDLRSEKTIWFGVRDALLQHAMPPATRPQPTPAERHQLISGIEQILHGSPKNAARTDPAPGRPTLRRLTRAEFDATIADLLGVRIDSRSSFPVAATVDGFDGNGDVQFVTPTLLETYVDVVTAVLDRLFEQADLLAALGVPANPSAAWLEVETVGRAVVPRLMRQAFRRHPESEELDRRFALLVAEWQRTRNLHSALHATLRSVLLSPHFLFRVERGTDTDNRALSNDELATRLSYFLWSTMPDAELFRAADGHELTDRAGLRRQVARMLASPRARALATNFAARWLGVDRVLSMAKDVRKFRFDHRLRRAMHREGIEFFDRLRRDDRPVLELVDSRWGMLNARLAKHYGVSGVNGSEFRPVVWPDQRRGGVLGMAGVLAVTSYPLRTSPVQRGKWILETLLDAPPPPPPADAGELPKDDRLDDGLTLRQRLERHRSDARCATCHARMDPFGLALENFNAIGAWRDQALGQALDTLVTLPGGRRVDGPIELRAALLDRSEEVLTTIIRRLGGYATGRRWTRRDEPVVRSIRSAIDPTQPRVGELIQAIVASPAFRYRGPSTAAADRSSR